MSKIQYGLISETDARTLEKTIDLISDQKISILEVGIYGGDTGRGLKEYCQSIRKECFITGIDNNRDGEKLRFHYDRLIIGNSTEVYNQVEDNSQHLIFIDGDHSFAGVISDFFCHADKVKEDCFFAFHDTGKHIKSFSGFQHGDKENQDSYISVRKALNKLGLLAGEEMQPTSTIIYWHQDVPENWELIFDKADINDPAGGVCIFKKLY